MQRKWKRQWRRMMVTIVAPAALAATLFLNVYSTGLANPSGGAVTSGSGTITSSGATTTITQSSDKLAINWQSFSIARGETVTFLQPGAGSVALNRVIGNSGSAIYGALNANGKVFLINPNGILFAPGSQINVGGLVASAQKLTDSDFLSGKYTFSGTDGSVKNQGTIQTAEGGYVVLLGSQAVNEGIIRARQGSVVLAAGNAATLDFSGDGLINLNVSQEAIHALVANSSLIEADGGLVVMTAKAANALSGAVVNNSGIIRAQGLAERNGKIVLDGGNSGVVSVSGTLDASGRRSGLTGGTVKVLGEEVQLTSTAGIEVSGDAGGGTALIGGAYQGGDSEQTAKNTMVAAGAAVRADAITSGHGGQVVVWAEDSTRFAGTISAKGGKAGGNGGLVETSGKKTLKVADTASVNTLAPQGKAGNWLLDPADFTIAASGGDMTGAALSSNLNTGNVTVLSSNGTVNTTGSGDIYVNDSLVWSANTSLTLRAVHDISISNNITANGGNITVHANGEGNGGNITIANATINSQGGNITMGGGTDLTTGYAIGNYTDKNGIYLTNAILTAGAGHISLRGKGINGIKLDNGSQLVTTTGKITLTGTGRGLGAAGIMMTDGSKLQAAGGTITLAGSASPDSNDQGYTTGTYIKAGSSIKNTGGAINIAGTAANNNPAVTLSGNYNKGVIITDENTLIEATGAINITGTGGGVGSDDVAGATGHGFGNNGVQIDDKATVTTGADITITGTGGAATNSLAWDGQQGIVIAGGIVKTTGTGNILMTGTGGNYTAAPYNHGIQLNLGHGSVAEISTQGGNITLTGHGSGQFSSGFVLRGGSKISAGGTGHVTISGDTFAGGAVTGSIINPTTDPVFYREANDTWATRLANGTISTVDGTLTITGTNLTDAINSPGNTAWSGGISVLPSAVVKTTGSGNIVLAGTAAGTSQSGENYGVWMNGQIQALGTGNISVTGTAGPAAGDSTLIDNYGVYVGTTADYYNYGSGTARITAAGGDIILTGVNNHPASGAGHTSYAVKIDSNGAVSTTGNGTVTVKGQGSSGSVSAAGNADNNGVGITAGRDITVIADQDIILDSTLTSSGGDITLAAERNFINNLPDNTGVIPGAGRRYLIYSNNPTDTIEGMNGYNERYGQAYQGQVPSYAATGNWFFYKILDNKTENVINMVITHTNQPVIPPTLPLVAGLRASDTRIPIGIVQTGINLGPAISPALTAPSSPVLVVTPSQGTASSYSVAVSGQAVTVSLAGAGQRGTGREASPVISNLAVIRTSEGTQAAAYFSVTGGKDNLTLNPGNTSGQSIPGEPTAGVQAASFNLSMADGTQLEFEVRYAEGAISIRSLGQAGERFLQAGGDSRLVVATGILVAQQSLGAAVQVVEAVYLH